MRKDRLTSRTELLDSLLRLSSVNSELQLFTSGIGAKHVIQEINATSSVKLAYVSVSDRSEQHQLVQEAPSNLDKYNCVHFWPTVPLCTQAFAVDSLLVVTQTWASSFAVVCTRQRAP